MSALAYVSISSGGSSLGSGGACMFLTLSLYIIMHVAILYVFWFAVYTCTCMSIRLPVHEHSCACLYMSMYVCRQARTHAGTQARTYVCMYVCMYVSHVRILSFWPLGLDPPLTKNSGSGHVSAWLSIYTSIENCPLIN